ncbi:MAG TPA: ATP-binding protein [bacterium]|nr:ATP-binding protein [bacterium]
MPSVETNVQTFRTLLLTRTVCVVMMFLLFSFTEARHAAAGVVLGWDILFLALFLSPLFWAVGRIKRLLGWLMPLMFLVDSLLVGAWVTASGGAVSFYMPYFLLLLVAAILILPRTQAILVVLLIFGVFFGTLYLDLTLDLPRTFEAGKINFVDGILDQLSPPVQAGLYLEQAVRWSFFFLLMSAACVLLMRQVWAREERLRAREKTLEQKRHLIQMGELTGRLAHGVNTPLGLISGHLEMLLAATRKGTKIQKELQQIDQYTQRAIRTVRDILDYGRQTTSEIGPVRLPQVVESVVASVQGKLQKTGGRLVLDLAPDIPPVRGYPEGIYQALLNLVENAIDSIQPNGIVTLSVGFQFRAMRLSAADRRGEIRVVVRDTGKGIPEERLKRLFEPFYSTKEFGKGTGLGLSIVKRIVDEHQGSIEVESRVGEGTVFTLLFPAGEFASRGDEAGEVFDYNKVIEKRKGPDEET